MDRRQFIETAATGALALGLPGAPWRADPAADVSALARPGLLAVLGEARVRAIGLRYREVGPCDVAALHTALTAGAASGSERQQQVRDDFAAGRTVVVDGWVLSVTEARQCALFSLLAP